MQLQTTCRFSSASTSRVPHLLLEAVCCGRRRRCRCRRRLAAARGGSRVAAGRHAAVRVCGPCWCGAGVAGARWCSVSQGGAPVRLGRRDRLIDELDGLVEASSTQIGGGSSQGNANPGMPGVMRGRLPLSTCALPADADHYYQPAGSLETGHRSSSCASPDSLLPRFPPSVSRQPATSSRHGGAAQRAGGPAAQVSGRRCRRRRRAPQPAVLPAICTVLSPARYTYTPPQGHL